MAECIKVFDQLGDEVLVPHSPKTIVSLVPSQTELLFDLGLSDMIAGVTKFCVHPADARSKVIVGGTKKFNFERIHKISPDLVIGNKEENYREGIEELRKHYPVWMSDINTLKEALQMISQLGVIMQREEQTSDLIHRIKNRFSSLPAIHGKRGKALYFIWKKPYMVAAGNTFIHEMLDYAGFENVAAHLNRYPELTVDQIRALRPDHLLLSSEPYPFRTEHIHEFKDLFPETRVHIVDGEFFSWYGSRLLLAGDYFEKLTL